MLSFVGTVHSHLLFVFDFHISTLLYIFLWPVIQLTSCLFMGSTCSLQAIDLRCSLGSPELPNSAEAESSRGSKNTCFLKVGLNYLLVKSWRRDNHVLGACQSKGSQSLEVFVHVSIMFSLSSQQIGWVSKSHGILKLCIS